MSYLTAVLLGVVQGIAEFLPISSSGHLALLQNIFHIEEADLLFDVMLHIGTVLAVIFTYKRDVQDLIRGGLGLIGMGKDRRRKTPKARQRRHMAVFVIVGSFPLLLAIPLKSWVETMSENTIFVGVMLIITGLILYLTGKYAGREKAEDKVSLLDVLLVGLGQVVAVIPGISRSGTTISVGMLRGMPKTYAVKFSFLLSIPAVLGAAVLELAEAVSMGIDVSRIPACLLGMLASMVAGYFSIRLLRWSAARSKLGGFAYYCWGAGIVALLLSLVA